jgi:hypothetical protein
MIVAMAISLLVCDWCDVVVRKECESSTNTPLLFSIETIMVGGLISAYTCFLLSSYLKGRMFHLGAVLLIFAIICLAIISNTCGAGILTE